MESPPGPRKDAVLKNKAGDFWAMTTKADLWHTHIYTQRHINMHLHTCLKIHTHTYTDLHPWMHTYTHILSYMLIYNTHTHAYTDSHIPQTHRLTHVQTHAHKPKYTHLNTYTNFNILFSLLTMILFTYNAIIFLFLHWMSLRLFLIHYYAKHPHTYICLLAYHSFSRFVLFFFLSWVPLIRFFSRS